MALHEGDVKPVASEKRVKTAQVNIRFHPDLKEAAERAAADDHRSLTSLIEKVLSDHLRERGYLQDGVPKRAMK